MRKCNFNNSLVSVSNSILKRFGAEPFHTSHKLFDTKLTKDKKIILFLFDGLSKSIIEKHLDKKSFIRNNFVTTVDSTYPPTTVAATTGLLSGKYPGETGYLGWSIHHNDLNRSVDVFTNVDNFTFEHIEGENIMNSRYPYENICERINKANGKEIAFLNYSYPENHKGTHLFCRWLHNASKLAHKVDETFVYSYHRKPDALIHEYGTDSRRVRHYIHHIDRAMKRFSKRHPDIALMILADHGLVNVNYFDITEHPEITSLMECPIYIEKRSAGFNIKPGFEGDFKKFFRHFYGDHFELFTKEEIEKEHIFTDGPIDEKVKKLLPTFLAVSKDNSALIDNPKAHRLKGHHGGATEEEYQVNIAYIHASKN